jgi:hypothetical protein
MTQAGIHSTQQFTVTLATALPPSAVCIAARTFPYSVHKGKRRARILQPQPVGARGESVHHDIASLAHWVCSLPPGSRRRTRRGRKRSAAPPCEALRAAQRPTDRAGRHAGDAVCAETSTGRASRRELMAVGSAQFERHGARLSPGQGVDSTPPPSLHLSHLRRTPRVDRSLLTAQRTLTVESAADTPRASQCGWLHRGG